MLNIVHLDDQPLLCKAVKKCLTQHAMYISYSSFHHSDQALQHIEKRLTSHNKIDVIITDFTHPGISGYFFAREVRKLEAFYSKRHPILLLTMMKLTYPLIEKGLSERTFDQSFNKHIESRVFLKAVERYEC
jgi:CheY-like chemotaxis protein